MYNEMKPQKEAAVSEENVWLKIKAIDHHRHHILSLFYVRILQYQQTEQRIQ
jgi:hypothetical protein